MTTSDSFSLLATTSCKTHVSYPFANVEVVVCEIQPEELTVPHLCFFNSDNNKWLPTEALLKGSLFILNLCMPWSATVIAQISTQNWPVPLSVSLPFCVHWIEAIFCCYCVLLTVMRHAMCVHTLTGLLLVNTVLGEHLHSLASFWYAEVYILCVT